MEEKGIGLGIDKFAPTEVVVNAINTVLNDKSYRDNVRSLSELMKLGMKQRPMDNAIWWLEYLSSTKGADHLKLSSRYLNFFQYHSLDCVFVMLFILVVAIKIVREMFGAKQKSSKKSKKD